MVARGDGRVTLMLERSEMTMATGDHKGPLHPTSSTLAPTDDDGLFLRVMPIGRLLWSPCGVWPGMCSIGECSPVVPSMLIL
jgi:hypothetical protein